MKILVAGIYRSGSTWMFNVVRLIMIQNGYNPKSVFYSRGVKLPKGDAVCKVHHWYKELPGQFNFVVTSFRNREGIVNSLNAIDTKNPAFKNAKVENINTYFENLKKYQKKSVFDMKFEDMQEDPKAMIEKIAKHLKMKVDAELLLKSMDLIKAPKKGSDPVTFMTETHTKFK